RGVAENGWPFQVLQYGGRSLADIRNLANGSQDRPTFREQVDIFLQCCEGVAALHSRTPPVFHRDIKPANILVRRVPGQGWQADIADLGLAVTGDAFAMANDQFEGTPFYAAPEALFGGDTATAANDVFALGAILAEVLLYDDGSYGAPR